MNKTYLALGDSYTIGEQVIAADNFPHQTATLLRQDGVAISDPTIVAVTGWTTDELMAGISKADLAEEYDLVTLLIGVNNQYRGRGVQEFAQELDMLLHQAIGFAKDGNKATVLLSIPDWGLVPFAEGRDRAKIATEIDAYNKICKDKALGAGVSFLDITNPTRLLGVGAKYLASDGLHYSGATYKVWAQRLVQQLKDMNWVK